MSQPPSQSSNPTIATRSSTRKRKREERHDQDDANLEERAVQAKLPRQGQYGAAPPHEAHRQDEDANVNAIQGENHAEEAEEPESCPRCSLEYVDFPARDSFCRGCGLYRDAEAALDHCPACNVAYIDYPMLDRSCRACSRPRFLPGILSLLFRAPFVLPFFYTSCNLSDEQSQLINILV